MLQLQVAYAYRRLPRCILLSHQRFVSEGTKSLRPPSKYKSELKNLITTFKKELGAVQAKEEKDAVKRKAEEQKEMQKMFGLNQLENKKIALHRAERVAKENEAKLLRRVKGDEKRATFKSEVLKEQTRRVENAIRQSDNFITRENLDHRIEEILDTTVNFDFCLTKSGKKIIGKV